MNTTINNATEEINAFQHMLHPSAMRAYFVAHAPEVPDWFHNRYATKDEGFPREATDEEFNAIFQRNCTKRFDAGEKAFFAWRLFYADQMIAALEAK